MLSERATNVLLRWLTAAALVGGLAGCESQARQDPLLVRGSTNATLFSDTPIYIDQTIARNITNSLVFKDYDVLLGRVGLMDVLRGPGPYTVFALTNPAIESIPAIYRERMLDPRNAPGLRHLLAYTIVPGRYTLDALVGMIHKGGGRTALTTLDGAPLGVELDPTGRHLLLFDPEGRVSHLELVDIIQSNGLLYAGDTILAPN